jgi:hypothetical protein
MEILFILVLTVLVLGGIYSISQSFKIWQNKRAEEWYSSQSYTTLRVDVPRNNDKAPLAAEQMFASIHGIYAESAAFQSHISFEIVARDKYIQFYVFVPKHLKDFVEGQIYAQYPTVEINEVDDYTAFDIDSAQNFACAELTSTKPDVYPIKLFSDFEVDPISGITSVMSKLNPGEQVWLQVIMRPIGDEWQERGNQMISNIRSGKSSGISAFSKSAMKMFSTAGKMFVTQAINPGAEVTTAEEKIALPGTVEEALKGIEFKIMKLGYQTKMRLAAIAGDPVSAKIKVENVAATFKQFNTTNANGFKISNVTLNDKSALKEYTARVFEDGGNILNISELASIYHFPHQTVETPNIVWSGAKKSEPPAHLPLSESTPADELTVLGETTFRNNFKLFGIRQDDRRRHIYIVGKSGTGKSVLLENMAINDIYKGRGVIVVDPHGEFAEKTISCIPDERADDVVVFDPADRGFPIAFNLLEHVEDDFKGMVASGFVGIFKKIFGHSWGPRLEHILRNTVLALLDYPESTMLDIPKMLTENHFRDKVVGYVKDPVIKDFWTLEFAQYDSKFRTEAVSPILNKIGQFLATATIRNIVGQPHSTLDIREIMDQKKIMIVNLSRGKIGEDNSALLGAMMITKIQLAAMSRADVTVDKRPDCFLYVDEFQNFATESFAVILSEARKYHLDLTIANQYIAQMPEEVRDAVFGNAGTIISFRVGGNDADFLVKEYEPVFDANDLVNLDKYNIYIKLLINGISSPAFSARTLPPVGELTGNTEKIIEHSRKLYAKPRADIERRIAERSELEQQEAAAEAEAFKEGGLEAVLTMKKDRGVEVDEKLADFANEVNTRKKEAGAAAIGGASNDDKAKEEAQGKAEEAETPKVPNITSTSAVSKTLEKPQTVSDDEARTKSEEVKKDGGEVKEKKPRVFKYQNIIGDKVYKEQTARGNVKWYVGDDIDIPALEENGTEINESAKKMIELAHKVGDTVAKKQQQPQGGGKKKKDKDKRDDSGSPHASHIKDEQKEGSDATNKSDDKRNEAADKSVKEVSHQSNDLKEGETVEL